MPLPAIIGGGLMLGGLIGGAISSQRKFKSYGDVNNLMDEFSDPSRNLTYFQRLAQSAGPSRSDLLSLAAATGGSAAAATTEAQDATLQANDQALQAFGRYRQGLDNLRANLASQKMGMKYQDFNSRREGMTSLFNNVAGIGGTMLGNSMAPTPQFNMGNLGGQASGMSSFATPSLAQNAPLLNSYASGNGNQTTYKGFSLGFNDQNFMSGLSNLRRPGDY